MARSNGGCQPARSPWTCERTCQASPTAAAACPVMPKSATRSQLRLPLHSMQHTTPACNHVHLVLSRGANARRLTKAIRRVALFNTFCSSSPRSSTPRSWPRSAPQLTAACSDLKPILESCSPLRSPTMSMRAAAAALTAGRTPWAIPTDISSC